MARNSLGRAEEGGRVGSRGANQVPRFGTRRSQGGGFLIPSATPFQKPTWRVPIHSVGRVRGPESGVAVVGMGVRGGRQGARRGRADCRSIHPHTLQLHRAVHAGTLVHAHNVDGRGDAPRGRAGGRPQVVVVCLAAGGKQPIKPHAPRKARQRAQRDSGDRPQATRARAPAPARPPPCRPHPGPGRRPSRRRR